MELSTEETVSKAMSKNTFSLSDYECCLLNLRSLAMSKS